MVTQAGTPFTYGYQNIIRDLGDVLAAILKDQASFLSLIEVRTDRPAQSHKHEWAEDEIGADESTVATKVAAADTTSIVVANITPFQVGSICRFEPADGSYLEEQVRVTAVDADTKTLTVARGYASSTSAASIAAGTKILVNSNPQVEASRASLTGSNEQPDTEWNATEIFDWEATVPKNMERIYGISGRDSQDPVGDALNYYTRINLAKHAMRLRNAVLHGRRHQRESKGDRGTMGGLLFFARQAGANIIDAKGNALSKVLLDDGFAACKAGGAIDVDTACCNIDQARNLSKLHGDKLMIVRQEGSTEPGKMGSAVYQVTPGFPINGYVGNVAVETAFPRSMLWVGPRRNLTIVPLRDRQMQDAQSSLEADDFVGRRGLGEYTLEAPKIGQVGCLIVNLSTQLLK